MTHSDHHSHEHQHPLLDASIRIDSIPTEGRRLSVVATEDQRTVLAEQLGVTSINKLEANLDARRFRGGIRVEGALRATIVQPCVITFVPVTQEIDEPIDRVFLPGGEKAFAAPANAEVFVDLSGEDLPDHFEGPEADLTELIVETLSLAIDPYPRAPGASLDTLKPVIDDGEISPFSSLKALKDKPSKS